MLEELARGQVRLCAAQVEDRVAVLVGSIVGDRLEEGLDVREERVVEGGGQPGVKQDDVRHLVRVRVGLRARARARGRVRVRVRGIV